MLHYRTIHSFIEKNFFFIYVWSDTVNELIKERKKNCEMNEKMWHMNNNDIKNFSKETRHLSLFVTWKCVKILVKYHTQPSFKIPQECFRNLFSQWDFVPHKFFFSSKVTHLYASQTYMCVTSPSHAFILNK